MITCLYYMQDNKRIILQMEDNSHCVIGSSSSSSDDFENFMMLFHICEYNEIFLDMMSRRTSSLRGEDFMVESLNGHERTHYELF